MTKHCTLPLIAYETVNGNFAVSVMGAFHKLKTGPKSKLPVNIATFHKSKAISRDMQGANVRLFLHASEMLNELKAIGHQVQIDTGHFNRLQRLIEKIEGVK